MARLLIVLSFLVAACDGDDGGSRWPNCPGDEPCTPGDMCAGFESDYACTADGRWKCVPSGNVGDPCVAPDAPVDAPVDAP